MSMTIRSLTHAKIVHADRGKKIQFQDVVNNAYLVLVLQQKKSINVQGIRHFRVRL